MQLRIAFAGVLRAFRLVRGARYADLSEATDRTKISALENAKTSITIEQLEQIADSLGVDPIAMLAMSIAQKQGEPALTVVGRALTHVAAFEAEGGMKALAEQFDDGGNLIKRKRGKPLNADNEAAVLALKAAGMKQQQVAEQLGLALTSVRDYWKKAT
ncbi:helix-turn-helix transcriptional regulator [Pseudomonas soli]|uniref:helix-turn-helix domain-containing protein n=1 Tax=Pseudomonas soli TaxID=1306993 RepID=UPI00299F4ADB|nr:helix-turn-helix transcriptional regulator [Pseudomonas soli]MDW9404674.1 XRE family transcriptional regulator [Pseudomonas soli]